MSGEPIPLFDPSAPASDPAPTLPLPADVPKLGFYSHTDVETRQKAERLGFDLVVPRSRMAREAAALVESLL